MNGFVWLKDDTLPKNGVPIMDMVNALKALDKAKPGISVDELFKKSVLLVVHGEVEHDKSIEVLKIKANKYLILLNRKECTEIVRGGKKLYIGASSIGEMICDTKPLDVKRFKSSKDVLTGLNELDSQCLEWLETGRVGASSRALCFHLGGEIVKEKINEAFGESQSKAHDDFPHDPSDFNRCMKFFEAVPKAREKLSDMINITPQWEALVTSWNELEGIYNKEKLEDKAPELYAAMQKALLGSKTQPKDGAQLSLI